MVISVITYIPYYSIKIIELKKSTSYFKLLNAKFYLKVVIIIKHYTLYLIL